MSYIDDSTSSVSQQLYGPHQGMSGGYAGFGYMPVQEARGLPGQLFGPAGFGGAATDILRGSINADRELHDTYNAILRHKTEGIFGGLGEQQDRLGAQAEAAGYSPELARMMRISQTAGAQQAIGSAAGEAGGQLHDALAQLEKGTGTELAGLKQYELGALLTAITGHEATQAASKGQTFSAGASGIGSLAALALLA